RLFSFYPDLPSQFDDIINDSRLFKKIRDHIHRITLRNTVAGQLNTGFLFYQPVSFLRHQVSIDAGQYRFYPAGIRQTRIANWTKAPGIRQREYRDIKDPAGFAENLLGLTHYMKQMLIRFDPGTGPVELTYQRIRLV